MIRTRLNSRERKKLYKLHVAMYGENCRHCYKTPRLHGVNLNIDRIDNNDPEYTFEKTQLLCKSCNGKKNPRGKAKKNALDKSESECVREKETQYHTNEIEISREKKPQFEEYVAKRVNKSPKGVPMKDLIHSAAYVLDISSVTTGRYLDILCSSVGPYEKVKDGKITKIRKKKR